LKRVLIERKSKISPADVTREHLRGRGMPVVITDGTKHWPALSKWTFEFFKATYGSDFVTPQLGLGSRIRRLTKLGAYIDFLDDPTAELPGIWVDRHGQPLRAAPEPGYSPPYLLGWRAFHKHPELYDDITPAPNFVDDLVPALSPTLRQVFEWTATRPYWAVYLGPAGSFSPLHFDYWKTYAYLAQIQGRKKAILFSPEDSDFLYDGQVDPERPDLERFPLFDRATAYECLIEPGETLLMPADWWHWVKGLEKSITVSHNFFNAVNFDEHMTWLLRNLPRLAKGLEQAPQLREELKVRWSSAAKISAAEPADIP
jgi:Cupin-like domain